MNDNLICIMFSILVGGIILLGVVFLDCGGRTKSYNCQNCIDSAIDQTINKKKIKKPYCGDGFCDLFHGETHENCREDCRESVVIPQTIPIEPKPIGPGNDNPFPEPEPIIKPQPGPKPDPLPY